MLPRVLLLQESGKPLLNMLYSVQHWKNLMGMLWLFGPLQQWSPTGGPRTGAGP